MDCPRCGKMAFWDYGELWCLPCGPVDVPLTPERIAELRLEVERRAIGHQRVREPSHMGQAL